MSSFILYITQNCFALSIFKSPLPTHFTSFTYTEMPRGREDTEEESDYLGTPTSIDEPELVPDLGDAPENHSVAETTSLRIKSHLRTLEWSFFNDIGKWGTSQASNHRTAECKKCKRQVRSKRETMHNHIKACRMISATVKNDYYASNSSWKPTSIRNEATSNAGNINKFFQPKISKTFSRAIESQMVRAIVTTDISFNALCHPEFVKLFRMLNPSFTPSSVSTLRTSALNRVSQEERDIVDTAYTSGSFISLSVDGWKTPGHKKWLGFSSILRSKTQDSITIDTRRFEDITLLGENKTVMFKEIKMEIESIMDQVANLSKTSTMVCVMTDSVSSNVEAKKRLSKIFPNLLFLPCHAHQLNLLAGNVLNHTTTKPVVKQAIDIINYFHNFPAQYSKLQKIMLESCGKEFKFVLECETRWYSHYQMILSLFRARPFLEKYKASVSDNDPLLKKSIAVGSLDSIGSTSFWSKLGLLSEILKVLTIEIANIERRKAGMSDVIQSFGRVWAVLQNLNVYQSHRYASLPGFLDNLLTRWDWRINIYFDVDLLILAHVLDPNVGMKGLLASNVTRRRIYQILIKFSKKLLAGFSDNSPELHNIRQNFVNYLKLIENSDNIISDDNDPFRYWSTQAHIDFPENSPLRKLALFIFAAPATAADLERIWSSCLMTLAPRRRKLKKAKVLQTVQIKSSIKMKHKLAEEMKIRQKRDEKIIFNTALTDNSQDTKLSENNTSHEISLSVSSDSSSSDSDIEPEDLLSAWINEMENMLAAENIEERASNDLDDFHEKNAPEPEMMPDSEIEEFLNSKVSSPPTKKARKMPNYRKVTQNLSKLIDFDIYKPKATHFYSTGSN